VVQQAQSNLGVGRFLAVYGGVSIPARLPTYTVLRQLSTPFAKNIFSKILQQGSSGVDFSISLLSNHRSIAYSCARQFLASLKMRLVLTTVHKDPIRIMTSYQQKTLHRFYIKLLHF
jgi:hypothetical protein